jgi:DNA-binding GntR family transcriptional regulator
MAVAVGKQEMTYQALRERIVSGEYGPGHRLVIDALARELGVSPMPVREAIRRLEAEGWVNYQRHQGAQVAPIDRDAWVDAMSTLAVLEGYATALAASVLDADDLRLLRSINGEMGEAIEGLDILGVSEANRRFHGAIYARCPNGHLRDQLASASERLNALRNNIFMSVPSRGHASRTEHDQLLSMIEEGRSPLDIELVAREHKMHTVAAYRQRLPERKS